MKPVLFLPLFLLLLAGCVTTPAQRIARNRAAFGQWPPEVQARVRAGEVGLGFTPAQVAMALGEPDHTFVRTTAQGTEEVWAYRRHKPRITLGIGVSGGSRSTRVGGATVVHSGGPYEDEAMRVIFQNGRVSAIEQVKP